MGTFQHLILLCISSFIIWKVCDSFQIASLYLGRKMPLGTRGATINAIGSSFPEFITSFIAIFQYSKDDGALFGIANTTGSVIYNITMIPVCVIISCLIFKNLKHLKFQKYILLRDGAFLIIIQIILMMILGKGSINIIDSLLLVFLYLFYLLLIFNYPKKARLSEEDVHNYEDKKANDEKKISRINKQLKHILHAIYDIDLYAIFFRKHTKQTHKNSLIVLLLSIAIFYLMCNLLVASSYALGDIWNIPSYLIAMSVTAVATSIPDTVLSVKDAKIGEFDEAITNAFGSNIFNISFCIGFPFLIYTIFYGTDVIFNATAIENINQLKNISIILVIVVVFIFLLKGRQWLLKGSILCGIYIVFIFYMKSELERCRKVEMLRQEQSISIIEKSTNN